VKLLVIIAHPNLAGSRVNRRWMEELHQHHDQITVHSLYDTYPDEQLDVEREQKLLLEHDRIVLQFPLYWYSTPSLLKKWQDTVLTYGWAYGPGGTKLNGKDFIMAVSTGGPEVSYQAGGFTNYSLGELLRPLQAMVNLVGGNYLIPFRLHGAVTAGEDEISESAKNYVKYILTP